LCWFTFSDLALEMMATRKQSAELTATNIALNLTRLERVNTPGRGPWTQVSRKSVDLGTLGEPTVYPDGAGTRVWVIKAPEASMYHRGALTQEGNRQTKFLPETAETPKAMYER
jgi:hypothetical protein